MSDANVRKLARQAGLQLGWVDQGGKRRSVTIDTLRAVLGALGLPAGSDAQRRASEAGLQGLKAPEAQRLVTAQVGQPVELPPMGGSWRIALEGGGHLEGKAGTAPAPDAVPAGYHKVSAGGWSGTLAVAPRRGWTLADAGSGSRLSGLAVQLYSLRRKGDGGLGDFAALAKLAERAAAHGIDAIAISPVHALFAADPGKAEPYRPSSRIALNPVYAACEIRSEARAGGDDSLIDWPAAVGARLAALRRDFARDAGSHAFTAFRRHAGADLCRHALFEAISAEEVAKGGSTDWRSWPAGLATPDGAEVKRFAARAEDEIAFHLYLQYRAAAAFAEAGRAAWRSGMRIGLIADLAVGVDAGGSDAWTRQKEMLRGLSVGAPPDDFNRAGQNWGLTTFSPFGLGQSGFSGWIAMLRAGLTPGGGLRIDHAMGLARLWVIPEGASATDGAYLEYPVQDLIRLVALESRRQRGVILGEDLGTVPRGFSERLAEAGIAGLRVLWFERSEAGFRAPEAWEPEAAAMTTTHDLPTVAGWWAARDLEWRERLDLRHETAAARGRDRHLLWRAFRAAEVAEGKEPGPSEGGRVAAAAALFLGKTASRLALLPAEDALALVEQPNLPGTGATDGHPNWCRRLPAPVETMLDRPDVAGRLNALRAGRGEA